MVIKWKNSKWKGIFVVFFCMALTGVIMCNLYPVFRKNAENAIQAGEKAQQEQEAASKEPSAFTVDDEFERYLLSSIYYLNYEITPNMDAYAYLTQNYDTNKLTSDEQAGVKEAASRLMKNMRNQYVIGQDIYHYAGYAKGVDKSFGNDSLLAQAVYDSSGYVYDYYDAGLVISYDSRGVPDIRQSWNLDLEDGDMQKEITVYLEQATTGQLMDDNGMDVNADYFETYYDETAEDSVETETEGDGISVMDAGDLQSNDEQLRQMTLPTIQNTTFVFGINRSYDTYSYEDGQYWLAHSAYSNSGIATAGVVIMIAMAILALILQNIPALELRKYRIFRLPTEINVVIAGWGCAGTAWTLGTEVAYLTLKRGPDSLAGVLESDLALGRYAGAAAVFLIWLFWSCFAFGWYWCVASLLPYITHPIRTLWNQALVFRFFAWLKRQWMKLWNWATDVQLDEHLTRNIWKVVGINGLIVILLCCTWFGGIVGAIIYSLLLYVLIKKKCSEIQNHYKKLLNITQTIAEGDLNASTEEDMGVFNPVRDELASIQSGFRKAVDEEVRSRNMKTELITNVSHDLKTPLTAIITYVDLLKKEDITEEERKEYVATLEKKSHRLKVLIEDLFEISKATTDNIVMNYDDVDLVSLIKEVRLENEDKIQESKLDFRWSLPEEKCILRLDPQRTFRIIDNLVQNILKYSMANSRVYISMNDQDGRVTVSLKNMSATEMNFTPEEITERFVRGDLSRNTEGSGLGLAIAQSFTELQGGEFKVETDGDLFKVTIIWKKEQSMSFS